MYACVCECVSEFVDERNNGLAHRPDPVSVGVLDTGNVSFCVLDTGRDWHYRVWLVRLGRA